MPSKVVFYKGIITTIINYRAIYLSIEIQRRQLSHSRLNDFSDLLLCPIFYKSIFVFVILPEHFPLLFVSEAFVQVLQSVQAICCNLTCNLCKSMLSKILRQTNWKIRHYSNGESLNITLYKLIKSPLRNIPSEQDPSEHSQDSSFFTHF